VRESAYIFEFEKQKGGSQWTATIGCGFEDLTVERLTRGVSKAHSSETHAGARMAAPSGWALHLLGPIHIASSL